MFSHTDIIGNEKVDKHVKDVITSINDVEYDIKRIAKQKYITCGKTNGRHRIKRNQKTCLLLAW